MSTTKLVIKQDEYFTAVTVQHHGKHTDTVIKYFDNGYYSKVSLDGNSNMIIEWKHGQGQGRISIPHGACFDIVDSLKILEALGRNLISETEIYKETT